MKKEDHLFSGVPEDLRLGPVFGPEEADAVKAVVESGSITQLSTDVVETFERQFAEYVGAKEAVAVSSGTAAVHTALAAVGVEEGDEVIVPAFTFIGTVGPVLHQHAVPVFADIDPETLCLDPLDAERKITTRTKAIIPVDLFGHPANLTAFADLADQYGVQIVEDACQAHGACFDGQRVGGVSPIAAFSFQESKNMTTGEGGMITTNDGGLADGCRCVRQQGERSWGEIVRRGHNYRMTALQAAIGIEQLKKLDGFNERRVEIASIYAEALNELDLSLPQEKSYASSVCHVYSFLLPAPLAPQRDSIVQHLREHGVPVSVAYPSPLYHSPVFQAFAHEKCPVSEDTARRVVTLPTSHSISTAAAERIGNAAAEVLAEHLA